MSGKFIKHQNNIHSHFIFLLIINFPSTSCLLRSLAHLKSGRKMNFDELILFFVCGENMRSSMYIGALSLFLLPWFSRISLFLHKIIISKFIRIIKLNCWRALESFFFQFIVRLSEVNFSQDLSNKLGNVSTFAKQTKIHEQI